MTQNKAEQNGVEKAWSEKETVEQRTEDIQTFYALFNKNIVPFPQTISQQLTYCCDYLFACFAQTNRPKP